MLTSESCYVQCFSPLKEKFLQCFFRKGNRNFLIFKDCLMATVNLPLTTRTYLQQSPPTKAAARRRATVIAGCCPCQVTNTSEHTYPNGAVRRVAEMVLQDHTRRFISLSKIHRDLENAHLPLHNSGSSNICLCRIGFNCQVNLIEGQTVTNYFSFDLKIPGDRNNQGVFSSDMMITLGAHGNMQGLHTAIGNYHGLGRPIANPNLVVHGNQPIFNLAQVPPNNVNLNLSLTLHTEQMLVAYLDLPQAATMLKNRLITHIRGEFSNATSATIHAVGIHLSQNKTCCSACEYSLVGLMQSTQQGLIPNLRTACTVQDGRLVLQMNGLPNLAPFPMVTTVTAKEPDAAHRALPQFSRTIQLIHQAPIRSIIDLTVPATSQRIYTSILSPHNNANIPITPSQYDGSVAISGSLATAGSPGTIAATFNQRDAFLDHSTAGVSRLLG